MSSAGFIFFRKPQRLQLKLVQSVCALATNRSPLSCRINCAANFATIMAAKNGTIILKTRPPSGTKPTEDNFQYKEIPYPSEELEKDKILIKTLYLTVDPTIRFALNEANAPSYLKRWEVGETIYGVGGIGYVVKSNHPNYAVGNHVVRYGAYPWNLYNVVDSENLHVIDPKLLGGRVSLALSLFGVSSGITSLVAIWEKGHIKPGTNQTFVVSGAAGACGSLAGQIAKLEGAGKVIGICGTDDKCKFVRDLGFDVAINYKTENVGEKLKAAAPNGVDIYFDNVGGEISDTIIEQMNKNSHVILCGQISQYDKDVVFPFPAPPKTKAIIEERNIARERYLVLEYPHRFIEAKNKLAQWLKEGKIKVHEVFEEGLENAPRGFLKMMRGDNTGKQLIHVADP